MGDRFTLPCRPDSDTLTCNFRPTLRRSPYGCFSPVASLWANYPHGEPELVKALIGGNVNSEWIDNTCAIRLSHALNRSGHKVQEIGGVKTVSGANGNRYMFRVREAVLYLRFHLGEPTPCTQGQRPTASGIIWFDDCGWMEATGHVDLWNGVAAAHDEYFGKARRVFLWAMP